jgi:hypothetical protein
MNTEEKFWYKNYGKDLVMMTEEEIKQIAISELDEDWGFFPNGKSAYRLTLDEKQDVERYNYGYQ